MFTTTFRNFAAIILTSIIGWLLTYLSIYKFETYASGLFVFLPLAMGIMATVLAGYKTATSKSKLRIYTFITMCVFCLGLLLFAFDGLICIAMALPIGLFFTWIGHLIGYQLIKHNRNGIAPIGLSLFLLAVPAIMGFEYVKHANIVAEKAHLRQVATQVEIEAPADVVWQQVIAFREMAPPTEFLFKTGIAYPINAIINGQGVGAIRYCNFSTGNFVEPITTWEPPQLLRFDVITQPEPLKEISPYDIQPKHLHGYWESKKGQFKLTKLPNGQTLLEGTTWYENKILPGFYWSYWSDYILHSIHLRVLKHIKTESEKAS
jgi:hypothetical protein